MCLATITVLFCAASPGLAQAVRDSAGIQIVENAKPAWTSAQALRLSKTPTLVIGTQAGEPYELSRVRGAVRLGGGRIAIGDGGTQEIRMYDANGKYTKTVARKGQGPGEFEELERLDVLPGDTLAGLHGNGFRMVSLFTGDGKFIYRLTSPADPRRSAGDRTPFESHHTLLTASGARRLVAVRTSGALPRSRGAEWTESQPLAIVDRSNVVLGSLGAQPTGEYVMEDRPQYRWLGPTRAVATNGTALFVGYGSEYSIRVFTPMGKLTRIIRRAWTPVPITKSDANTFVVEWSKRWANEPGAEGDKAREDIRNDPKSTKVPAYSQLIADRVGRLWVREAHLADAPRAGNMSTSPLVPTVWSIFDTAGKWQGDVTMPAFFFPADIGANYVLGVARDDDGVETVVMYSLAPSGSIR